MKTDVVPDLILVATCVAYGAVAWLFQAYRVVAPRDWLRQRIRLVRALVDDTSEERLSLDWLDSTVKRAWWRVATSRVQAGWRHVHAIEDGLILNLPSESVDEQLQTVATRLSGVGRKDADALKERIDAKVKQDHGGGSKRALLREASVYLHNLSDTSHEDLAALLAKAVWLTFVALALVVCVGLVFDRETYFLLGAAGGLLSRLTRVLERKPRAADYGAAWSTLILGPAGGALTGWIGILLVVALAGEPFNVLDDAFRGPWDDAASVLGLTVAFISGFSERWFNRLLGTAETQLSGELPSEPSKDSPGHVGSGVVDAHA